VNKQTQPTTFQQALESNIKTFIREARKAGTVGMGIDNLRQCVPTPSWSLPDAPVGPLQYATLFAEVCQGSKSIESFLI
jgi:hypothetical protein